MGWSHLFGTMESLSKVLCACFISAVASFPQTGIPLVNQGPQLGPLTPAYGDLVATPRGLAPISLEGFSEDLNQDGFVDPVVQTGAPVPVVPAPALAAQTIAAAPAYAASGLPAQNFAPFQATSFAAGFPAGLGLGNGVINNGAFGVTADLPSTAFAGVPAGLGFGNGALNNGVFGVNGVLPSTTFGAGLPAAFGLGNGLLNNGFVGNTGSFGLNGGLPAVNAALPALNTAAVPAFNTAVPAAVSAGACVNGLGVAVPCAF